VTSGVINNFMRIKIKIIRWAINQLIKHCRKGITYQEEKYVGIQWIAFRNNEVKINDDEIGFVFKR